MSDTTIVYLIIAAAVVLFVTQRLPPDLVAVGVALALYLTDVITMEQAFAGFGDPTVIFIATLFVVSEALDASGVTTWAGQQLTARAGGSPTRLLVVMMLLVAGMSALVTPNGAVSALVPVVVITAMRLGLMPSQLLLPLAFASFAGSLLVLTGSPVSVIASDTSREAGGGGFAYLEFALVGVPLLIGTVAITLIAGPRLLPRRRPRSMPSDFSEHARALMGQYAIEEPVFRLTVLQGSPLVGATRERLDLAPYPGVEVIAAQEEAGSGALRRPDLAAGDVVAARGERETVERMAEDYRLHVERTGGLDKAGLFTIESGVVEVVVPPRSSSIGQVVFPGMITESGDLVILAVQRAGEDRPGKTRLEAGDTLLLRGRWHALDEATSDPGVRVVDRAELLRRQLAPLGLRAKLALAVLAGMVILLISGAAPPAAAGMIAAVAMVLFRVLTVQQAYRGISWTVVVLIAGMIPLSTAMTQTGAAQDLADGLVNVIGDDASPYVLIIGLFILVAVIGQLISNTATALIVFPVAVAAAAQLDVSIQPVLMAVNVAAHASFITPIATTPNLMVFEPGGYRFGDYWKLGSVLMLFYFLVAVLLVPIFWPF